MVGFVVTPTEGVHRRWTENIGGLCLAEVGRQYLIYLPEGGDAVVDLSAVTQNTSLTAEWMDIYSGDRRKAEVEKARKINGFATCVENPLQDKQQPCVLTIRVSR